MSDFRTIVVGGGIVGLSAACFLARRGARVTVVERDALGDGASAGNAGILAAGHTPLPQPGLMRRLARVLFDSTNPLYVAPRLDPSLIRWLVSFLAACREDRFNASLDNLCQVGSEASACIRRLIEDEGIDCEFHPRGWLEVCLDPERLAHARPVAEHLRRFGYNVDEYDGAELRRREPAFRPEVVGAMHFTDSAFANPRRFVLGLADAASRHGAELLTGCEVKAIRAGNGRFRGVQLANGEVVEGERLVLAAGAWTTGLAKSIGIDVPMQAGKGYHVNLDRLTQRPSTTCVLAESFVAATPLDGGLRLAGTVEIAGLNLDVSAKRLARLRQGARRYLEGIDGAEVASTWCGLRPLTADGLPAVGWAPRVEGIFVATGHAMMGFLLGPLSGRVASEAILDGSVSVDVSPWRVDRF